MQRHPQPSAHTVCADRRQVYVIATFQVAGQQGIRGRARIRVIFPHRCDKVFQALLLVEALRARRQRPEDERHVLAGPSVEREQRACQRLPLKRRQVPVIEQILEDGHLGRVWCRALSQLVDKQRELGRVFNDLLLLAADDVVERVFWIQRIEPAGHECFSRGRQLVGAGEFAGEP